MNVSQLEQEAAAEVIVSETCVALVSSFSQKLQETVRLLAPCCDITFLVSEDSSGKGAAMVTAVSQQLALQSRLLEDGDEQEQEAEEAGRSRR